MPDDIVVDDAALENLKKLGGAKLLREVIDIFSQIAPKKIQEARAAVQKGDWKALGFAVHSLKSSAGNLGAMSLHALCHEIEGKTIHGKIDDVAARVDEMDALTGKVLGRLKEVRATL